MNTVTTYQIETEIPAEHAIGGVAYWSPLRDIDGRTEFAHWDAIRKFAIAKHHHRRVRLVKIERTVVDEHEGAK